MRNYVKLLILAFLFFTVSSSSFAQMGDVYGKASYYSDTFHGGKVASGGVYDKNKLTGAHKTLDFGTNVKVTRLDDPTKSVIVTITDRGPFIKGRIIEVSSAAASKIGLLRDGVTEVKIEVVGKKTLASNTQIPKSFNDEGSRITTTNPTPVNEKVVEQPKKASVANNTKVKAEPTANTTEDKTAPKGTTMALRQDTKFSEYDLYKISLVRPEKSGFGVQILSTTDYSSMMKEVAMLESKWFQNILISIEKGDSLPVYKIILGHFDSREKANSYKNELKKNKKIAGFVVDLSEK